MNVGSFKNWVNEVRMYKLVSETWENKQMCRLTLKEQMWEDICMLSFQVTATILKTLVWFQCNLRFLSFDDYIIQYVNTYDQSKKI